MTKKLKILIYILLLFLFGIGFIWNWNMLASSLGLIISLVLFAISLNNKIHKFKIPDNFLLLLVFIGIFFLYEFWFDFRNRYGLVFLLNLVSGSVLWLIFYNYSKILSKIFWSLLVFFSFVIPVAYLLTLKYISINFLRNIAIFSFNLPNHRNIGDFMIIPLLMSIGYFIKSGKKKLTNLLFLTWSVIFLLNSSSRAAIASLFAGMYLLFKGINFDTKIYKYRYIFFGIVGVIFVYFSSTKSLFFNRQYYFQGLWGLAHYPFGVDFGRFGVISADPRSHVFGLNGYSSSAFNILLEMLTGLGVFGVVFVIWFLEIVYMVVKNENMRNNLTKAIFIAITISFLFDNTYTISSLLWIWFASLGIYQSET